MKQNADEGGVPMAKKVEVVVEEAPEQASPLAAMLRRVLLAGIGAVALTQEEIEKFVDKLVERGELAQEEGKKVVSDVMEKRKQEAKKSQDELDKRMEVIMDRMNVPSKSDIDALSAKITALGKKVDELKQS
jgi:poly(hydroxyalkanoate) granule-associated protein